MKRIKLWLISLFLIIIIMANLSNIINQVVTLVKVKGIVRTQAEKIEQLKEKGKVLADQVEYAQSDEYVERVRRSLLGLGTENDYWILLPRKHSFESIYPNSGQNDQTSNWKKWLNLIVVKQ